MYHFKSELSITSSNLNRTTLVFLIFAFIPSRLFFTIFFVITNLVLILNIHCIRVYHQLFSDLGVQFLSASFDSNIDEILTYFKFLSLGDIASIVVLVLLSIVCLTIKNNKTPLLIKSVKVAFATLIFVVSLNFTFVNTFINQYKQYSALGDNNKELLSQKNHFKWGAIKSENSPRNVIVFIGESMRYDNFIKYWNEKDTVVFSDTISQYGYTLGAMPQILSRKQIQDKTGLFYESSIFKLFEEAGYDTHYISYLKANNNGDDAINFIVSESNHYYLYGPANRNFKKKSWADGTDPNFVDDMDIVSIVKEIINNSSKNNLIVIKIIGNHWNFEDRYPTRYDINQPSLKTVPGDYILENKQRIINTYNNSILYSIRVINSVINLLRTSDQSSLLVYSSDHGLNIFDNNVWNTPQVKQTYHIPLLWYANQTYLNNKLNVSLWNKLKNHKDDAITTSYIFETIASLSFINHENKNNQKDLTKIINKITEKRAVVGNRKDTKYYEEY